MIKVTIKCWLFRSLPWTSYRTLFSSVLLSVKERSIFLHAGSAWIMFCWCEYVQRKGNTVLYLSRVKPFLTGCGRFLLWNQGLFLQLTVSLKKTVQDTESLFELRTVGGVGFWPCAVVNGSIYMNLVLECGSYGFGFVALVCSWLSSYINGGYFFLFLRESVARLQFCLQFTQFAE